MHVLIAEDDREIASFVEKGLVEAGFAVDLVADGVDAIRMAEVTAFDAVILDVMLPGIDGLEVLRRLRAQEVSVPILILSAKSSIDDRLEGFKAGTDDYLTKPFSFAELLMRVHALIRRSKGSSTAILSVGNLSMDLLSRTVSRGDESIELQPREYSLLEYLLQNAGNVVTKTMILEHVWDYHFDPQTNVVDVLIHRLRNKVDRDFDQKLIHTIRGVGYVLKVT